MTKSTITRERLEVLANAQYCKSNPGVWLLGLKEVNELARMALAAMESEEDCKERKLFCSTDTARMRKVISVSAGTGDAPLYHHAQQPVVEREPIAWLNDAYLARGVVDGEAGSEDAGPGYIPVYREAGPQPAPVVPTFDEWLELSGNKPLGWVKDAMRESYDACRAAMLAAVPQPPGSDLVTAPGKWIPVSERMPEDDDFVYIWPRPDFGVELHVGQYCERSHKGGGWYAQFYEQNYGIEWHPITVTHWMPLPNPPKE